MKIGFIGLGLMGRAMVECLQNAGHELLVLGNRDRTGVDEAVARGGAEATNARELAAASDMVMLCMATSEQVEQRIYGDDGVLAGTKADQIVIDFGTSLPGSTLKIGADLAAKGAGYLDAPLGRTPAFAKQGQLNILCGGAPATFERAKPVLDQLSENLFYLGELGSGHTVKLLNNYYAMTSASAMSEAFAMADAAGVDRDTLYKVVAAGPNGSAMIGFIRNFAVDGQIDLAFSVANARKDVGYYRQMVSDLGKTSRMSGAAYGVLSDACDSGDGQLMVPELVNWMTAHLEKDA